MSPYSIAPLISSVLFVALGYFVWSRDRKATVNAALALACVATFWWQASWVFLFSIQDLRLAHLVVKIGYSGIIFIPVTLYHFSTAFVGSKKDKPFVFASYLFGVFTLILLWSSPYFVDGVYSYFWGFYPKAAFLHPVYLTVLAVLAGRAIFLLIKSRREHSRSARFLNQTRYVFFAFIAYLFASSDSLVNYGIEFYPIGFIFILITFALMAYAIVKHQLMDIEVVVKKTLVFAGLILSGFSSKRNFSIKRLSWESFRLSAS